MPTYQYACTACDERLEVVQKFSDEPLTECPTCEGRLRKVFSPVGVVFKGSGFYKTDSRASTGSAESKAGADTKGDAKTDTKTDAKRDTQAGAKTDSPSASGSTGATSGDTRPTKNNKARDSKVA